MTLTLELTPAEEARLAAAARLNGLEPGMVVKKLLAEHLPPAPNGNSTSAAVQEQERIARIRAMTGCMADDSWDGVEELHRERQRDKAEEGWAGSE